MVTEAGASPAEIRAMIDRQQIVQLVYRYCRAVDRIDPALGYSIWHDGAEADYGRIYRGSGRGLIDYICEAHKKGTVHSHQITNILLDLEGDRARSESYVSSVMRLMDGAALKQIATRGRYLDRWSKRQGRWAIDKRIYVHDLDEIRPVTPAFVPPSFRLDRGDPSYELFDGAL